MHYGFIDVMLTAYPHIVARRLLELCHQQEPIRPGLVISPLDYVDEIPSERMVHGSGYVLEFYYSIVKVSMIDTLF